MEADYTFICDSFSVNDIKVCCGKELAQKVWKRV